MTPAARTELRTPKIFCIGFQKTGTSSLGDALRHLGYSVIGGRGTYDPNIAQTATRWVDRYLPRHDAFRDNPWAILYEYLDRKCPGSRFILTQRDSASWIASVVGSFEKKRPTPMRQWIHGHASPIGHEDSYVARYEQHNADVLEYFAGRGQDLLVMELAKGDNWEKLCRFLQVDIVQDLPFPRRNALEDKKKLSFKARRYLRKIRRRLKP